MMPRFFLLTFFIFLLNTSRSQTTDSIVLPNAVLYYYTYGSGQPVLILSGGPGIASHQEDDVALALGKKYKAILFDQRGTGASWTKPFDSTSINIDQAVEDIEILRRHLKLARLNLYGHSWGSMLGAAYIAKHPDKVALFITVGGGELDVSLTKAVDANIELRYQLSDSTQFMYWSNPEVQKKDPQKARDSLRKLGLYAMIYDRNKEDLVFKQVLHGARNAAMGSLMWKSVRKKRALVKLPENRYTGPSMIVYGWQDPIGLTTLTQYMQLLPSAEIKGIHNCGHFPGAEQPDEYFGILIAFLEKHLKSK